MKAFTTRLFIDDLSREIKISFPPGKIISLVPSITELLFDLQLEEKIVGVTKYCIHPKKAQNKIIIGGTKKADIKIIEKLNPDIIFAEKSENNKINILKIAENFNVFVFDILCFDNAIKMIGKIGDITNKKAQARIICDKIFRSFIKLDINFQGKTVFFPVWKNPYITINNNTFINSMLEIIGLKNIFATKQKNYPTVSDKEIKSLSPDFIFLPSEPYNFSQKDKNEIGKLCPNSEIIFVEGEMFIWYGSRMLNSAAYFKKRFIDFSIKNETID